MSGYPDTVASRLGRLAPARPFSRNRSRSTSCSRRCARRSWAGWAQPRLY